MRFDQCVISQCTRPDAGRGVTLPLFAQLGVRKVEAFCVWAASRLDIHADPAAYRQEAQAWGLDYHTLHLPALAEKGVSDEAALREALDAIAFAARLGMRGVYLRSRTLSAWAAHGRTLVAAAAERGLVPLLEPHDHTPAHNTRSTLQVLEAVADDRLMVVLELGHLKRADEDWRTFYEHMGGPARRGGRVASVHLKNVAPDGRWAPWRRGTIDIPTVLQRLETDAFDGDLVIETELSDPACTQADLIDLCNYLRATLTHAKP